MVQLIKKVCRKCHRVRKFVKGTPRDEADICGECWEWGVTRDG